MKNMPTSSKKMNGSQLLKQEQIKEKLKRESKRSLYSIFLEKLAIQDQLDDSGGEITDELDIIWNDNELELKEKIDEYGYTLTEISAEEAKIKLASQLTSKKVKAALTRLSNLESRLKARLFKVSENKPLRGHIFSFHPYESTTHYIDKPELLKPNEIYLTIEIRKDYWESLIGQRDVNTFPHTIKAEKGKVSELPNDHPAVAEVRTPSITIR